MRRRLASVALSLFLTASPGRADHRCGPGTERRGVKRDGRAADPELGADAEPRPEPERGPASGYGAHPNRSPNPDRLC